MDYEKWTEEAQKSIDKVQVGKIFFLKDLFKGTKWNDLPVGDRLGLGRMFKNKVNSGEILNVEYVGKAQNNSAQYIKVKCNSKKEEF